MSNETIKGLERMIEVVLRSIPKEREAYTLYLNTSKTAINEMTRLLFEKLASQELEHESKLRAVLELLRNERERQLKPSTPH